MDDGKLILVIEDDPEIRRIVRTALASVGHRVIESDGVQVGLHLFRSQKPDLVILDLQLPDGNGLDACEKIRQSKIQRATPVIMLTGKGKLEDKISGFAMGADQYLVKPVHPKELLSWVGALLRRLSYDKEEGDELKAGDLAVDLKSHLIRYKGQIISTLTGKEFDLLYFLVKKRPQVLTRKYILSTMWHSVLVDNVVDTHISNLRKKLPCDISDKIQNVPGKGFRYLE